MNTSNNKNKNNSSDSSCDEIVFRVRTDKVKSTESKQTNQPQTNSTGKPKEFNSNSINQMNKINPKPTITPVNNIKKPQPIQFNHPVSSNGTGSKELRQSSNVIPIPEYIITHLNATAEQINKTQYMLNNAFLMLASLCNNCNNQSNCNNQNNCSNQNNWNNQGIQRIQPIQSNWNNQNSCSNQSVQFNQQPQNSCNNQSIQRIQAIVNNYNNQTNCNNQQTQNNQSNQSIQPNKPTQTIQYNPPTPEFGSSFFPRPQ